VFSSLEYGMAEAMPLSKTKEASQELASLFAQRANVLLKGTAFSRATPVGKKRGFSR